MYELNTTYKFPSKVYYYFLVKIIFIVVFLYLANNFLKLIFSDIAEAIVLPLIIFLEFLIMSLALIMVLLDVKNRSFSIHRDHLVTNSGVFRKNSKSIIYNQIQNINCASSPISRIFNLSSVQIWTASPSQTHLYKKKLENEPEAAFLLKKDQAYWLRDFITENTSKQNLNSM